MARIWYSAETDDIASKENAADWLLERLPAEYRDVLRTAQEEYLGHENRSVTENPDAVEEFILYAKQQIENILSQ